MNPDSITVKLAAELAGYTTHNIRRLARTGVLKADRFGTAWAIDRTSLLDHIAENKRLGQGKHAANRYTKDLGMIQKLDLTEALVLDTETTGLGNMDQIVEIAIIDMTGNLILQSLLNPTIAMTQRAYEVHRIGPSELDAAPLFPTIWPELIRVLNGKKVIAYNANFDMRMIAQTAHAFDLDLTLLDCDFHCAMRAYAMYRGGRRNYKLTTACAAMSVTGLPEGMQPHRAQADAELTRQLVLKMLETPAD